jgi:SulP family sulfate permease
MAKQTDSTDGSAQQAGSPPHPSSGRHSGFAGWLRACAPRVCLPFLREIPRYSRGDFKADLCAAFSLALISVPQAIGFALILGLPPAPVVFSVVVGGFAAALFFSSHHHVFGPTSSSSLVVATTLASLTAAHGAAQLAPLQPLQLAVFMALVIGVVQVAAGLLRFGEVTKFISRSVVVAYGAAIGLVLVTSQLPNLLGVKSSGGAGFLASLSAVAGALPAGISWPDAAIGCGTLVLFFVAARRFPGKPADLVVVLALALGSLAFAWLRADGGALDEAKLPFRVARDMGALDAVWPQFSGVELSREHLELLPTLLGGAVAIALLGMLESASITKGLAAKSGQRVDTNQELFGMGVGNIASALFGAVPGSSSFTRSAAAYQSGARTQFAAMLGSVAVLFALLFLTPVFNHIPLAALAAVLMRIGAKMVVPAQIRVACRSTRSDAAVFALTLGAALFVRLDIAIYAGIGLSLALFLQKVSAPVLVEYSFDDSGSLAQIKDKAQRVIPQIAIIHVEGELFFGAADVFLTQIHQQAGDENIHLFILRLKNARHLDASTAMALESLHESLRKTGRHLLVSGCTQDVMNVIRNSGILRTLGAANVFEGDPANPNVSTRRALLRAREVLASDEADIRIFYDRRRQDTTSTAAVRLDYQI